MKPCFFAALPALALLAACGEAATDDIETGAMDSDTATMAEPADSSATATQDGTAVATDAGDANGTTVSVDESGVDASIEDGSTRIDAKIDENPSATVTTE